MVKLMMTLTGSLEYIDKYKRLHLLADEATKKVLDGLKAEYNTIENMPFYVKKEEKENKLFIKITLPAYRHDQMDKYEMMIGEAVKATVKIIKYNAKAEYGEGLVFRLLKL